MAFANLYDLFKSDQFRLPNVLKDENKSFLHYFKLKMDEYLQEVDGLPEEAFDTLNKEFSIDRLKIIIYELAKCLEVYLNGYPSHAYNHFKDLVKLADIATELIEFRTIKLDSGYKFFRTKKEYDTSKPVFAGLDNSCHTLLSGKDLFHVPFEKRRAIGSNRFSIPGFPCIYFSDTLFTSWSECLEKPEEAFHAICFKNHRPLYVADLVPLNFAMTGLTESGGTDKLYDQIDDGKVITDYTFLYPLIFACHSKVMYDPDYPGEKIQFKSEYIIPQLLMQWYRERKLMIDGIRYLSCTAELRFPKSPFNKFNYVIPATENLESGFCRSLLINFSVSPVYTYIKTTSSKTVEEIIAETVSTLDQQVFQPLI